MLSHIRVQNIALIDEAEIDLEEGLNALTGETGAGKSILLGAISLALGQRGSKDAVRDPSRAAEVALLFTDYKNEVKEALEEMGVEDTDSQILIRRRFLSSGRSANYINDAMVTQSQIRKIASLLIDIHGQHEHQSLLNQSRHIDLLDRFISGSGKELEKMARLFAEYQELEKELSRFQESGRDRERLLSLMAYELSEIEENTWKEGEEENLLEERKKLVYSEKLKEESAKAYQQLIGEGREAGALDQLDEALSSLNRVAGYDEAFFAPQIQTLEESTSILRDLAHELRNYSEEIQADPERLSEIEERYDRIQHIKSKYGKTREKVEQYYQKTKQEYQDLENLDETIRRLGRKLDEAKKKMGEQAQVLTDMRKEAAQTIEKEITEVLSTLEFEDPVFRIAVDEAPVGAKGQDKVCFMIRTNVGEKVKPLSEIASGGEMSRVMLAIKTVLAKQDEIGTLIFDEIDSGISGRTAQSVAEKMALIAVYHQVICVTHLPQIAAMADVHLRIEKTAVSGHTVTNVLRLSEEEIGTELSRMLGGAKITEAVRGNAAEMKSLADRVKKELRSKV
ncbi:MAG: DNA repair protein RecN [Firmicutes bacterium]|nr:DNA repair protein RecN [Bacillota bacterium]